MKFINRKALILVLMASSINLMAGEGYISKLSIKKYLPLVSAGKSATLHISSKDFPGVHRVAGHLQTDIERVTGTKPELLKDAEPKGLVVIIGTLGKSPVIDQLARDKKIRASEVQGKWDTHGIQIVKNPLPNVSQALVIFGSDKRGTIYGMYDLSKNIGVSPWHYWADAPVQKSENLYVKPGFYTDGEPKVKYRGIFLNDEAPALSGWAQETFGGFNSKFYDTVFELIMRNRGNYLWPAMWPPSAFYDFDPENHKLADEYGVVMSTSHHEPLMRSHAEWYTYGDGPWNYESNKENLQEFWRGGIERMGDYESVVTMGMRGDGDEAMSEETAVDLLKTIIKDQREIIADVTGKPAEETPQVWAIYKEVQDYYDKGMRVDDDILVLYCDDNWGNIRILPKKSDLGHKGGFGIYYHFDFVGGPVSYRWLNVTQIERVWEQMNLAYQWGVEDLWIVNVGDLKPMELPISFFLDFAWNPEAIEPRDLPNYYTKWAAQQFGEQYAQEIGEMLALYTKYNARRTPEMLKPETYSSGNYRESDQVVGDYKALNERATKMYNQLPESNKAAFYQLVMSPIELCSNLNEMYQAAGKNKIHGEQSRASTNFYAEKTKELFYQDAALTQYFHDSLAGGKWNHMMAQTHIGYTSWNNPPVNKMPDVSYLQVPKSASLGYVVEYGKSNRKMPQEGLYGNSFSPFDPINDQSSYVEIFNKGQEKLSYRIKTGNNWIKLSKESGEVAFDEKVCVSIDWSLAPKEDAAGQIVISSNGREFEINVPIRVNLPESKGFVENNGVISIEAHNFNKAVKSKEVSWITIPNMGRTASAVTMEPANADRQTPGKGSPYLEYTFTVFDSCDVALQTYLSPTLNYQKNEGLKFAVSIDDQAPIIVNMHEGETQPDWEYPDWWNNSVTDHIKIKTTEHKGLTPGAHTLKVWMVDPGVVFQKFVIDAGGLKPSYLGPPESKFVK